MLQATRNIITWDDLKAVKDNLGNKAIGDAIKAQVDKFCFVGPTYAAESRATLGK